jgi:hypothetical protein
VNQDFFEGTSADYPVAFNNVIIATFMLDALRRDPREALAARCARNAVKYSRVWMVPELAAKTGIRRRLTFRA